MEIIDCHAHIFNNTGYVDSLIKMMDECQISKCCISGLGPSFYSVENEGIAGIIKQYPDRFIGAYFIRPGFDQPEIVDIAHAEGFKMIKVSLPSMGYDDPKFYCLWERAERYNMPILFHTGVITVPNPAPKERISSWDMHPMRLEPIANMFPKLNIIIAHLGVHWNLDAAELIRMRPNVYADITGEPTGWRKRVEQEGLNKYLWWEGAFNKILFGTDVIYSKIPQILEKDKEILAKNEVNQSIQKNYFGTTIKRLLNIE